MAGVAPGPGPPMAEPAPSLGWSGVSDKASYYRLFTGYVLAIFATGLATVALALLAFDLTGDDAGAVIGTALSLKMLAIVFAAPLLAGGGIMTAGLWTHVRDDRPFAGGGGGRWNRWEIGGWKASDMRRVIFERD